MKENNNRNHRKVYKIFRPFSLRINENLPDKSFCPQGRFFLECRKVYNTFLHSKGVRGRLSPAIGGCSANAGERAEPRQGGVAGRKSVTNCFWSSAKPIFLKSLFLSGVIFVLCVSSVSAQHAGETYVDFEPNSVISMDFKDADLKDVLKVLSIQSGMNFIASHDVEDRRVTMYLDNVSVKDAMDNLFSASNLDYEFNEDARIIVVREAKSESTMVTKVFPLAYARVSSSSIQDEINEYLRSENKLKGSGASGGAEGITAVIEKLVSELGSVVEDPRTNSLIITDFPSRFLMIESAINELDVPVPQVMLEVEMLDVSKNLVDQLGFDFGINPMTLIAPGNFRHADFFLSGMSGAARVIKGQEGAVTLGSTYRAILDFIRTKTDARYLARPRILTLNNETAEISIETDELIGLTPELGGEYGMTVTGYETEREKTGISLRVTPQVNLITGEIVMFIRPRVAEAGLSKIQPTVAMVGQTPYQDVEERVTRALVKVQDGETVIIGGLIHRDRYEVKQSVPILGDVPIVGFLFRHKNKQKDIERELLVFITPRIAKGTFSPLAAESNAIFSLREQDIPFRSSE